MSESSGGLVKHRPWDPTPRESDSVGLGGAPKACFYDKLLGGANAVNLGPHFEE